MAAAAAAQVLAPRNYFSNTLQIPVPTTDALIAEGGLTSFGDCILKDTKSEELVKNYREKYHPPIGGGITAVAHGQGGSSHGGNGRSVVVVVETEL
jgi:hypothetical protein